MLCKSCSRANFSCTSWNLGSQQGGGICGSQKLGISLEPLEPGHWFWLWGCEIIDALSSSFCTRPQREIKIGVCVWGGGVIRGSSFCALGALPCTAWTISLMPQNKPEGMPRITLTLHMRNSRLVKVNDLAKVIELVTSRAMRRMFESVLTQNPKKARDQELKVLSSSYTTANSVWLWASPWTSLGLSLPYGQTGVVIIGSISQDQVRIQTKTWYPSTQGSHCLACGPLRLPDSPIDSRRWTDLGSGPPQWERAW